jgi:ferredoxin
VRVQIDGDVCTGHGRCYAVAPTVFEDDEVGVGVVIVTGELSDEERAAADLAVRNCPERAISLIDT